jgi:ribosomal protein S27AE
MEIQEYKRTCKECGKVWHSLLSREKEINRGVHTNNCVSFGEAASCCGDMGAATQAGRSADAQKDLLDKLKKCPNCGSRNYDEKMISYEKES